jgi:hypothetical protein
MATKRMIITLSENDKKWLESYSRAREVSVVEAIREGIRKLRDAEFVETYPLRGERLGEGDCIHYGIPLTLTLSLYGERRLSGDRRLTWTLLTKHGFTERNLSSTK